MAGYDPKKAATYNKLIKQGLSEEAAQAQAGISDAEGFNYVIDATGDAKTNPNYGTMGSWVSGGGASGASDRSTVTPVNYNVKANNPPSTRTADDYTSTSTTQNSGKQVFIAATKPKDTEASRALQPAIDAKQAEFNQFVKDNPSDFVRKKQGLPPLTPAELAAREQRYAEFTDEKLRLTTQQNELKTPGDPARFETANTTTSATTTTFGTQATNTAVDSPNAADPAIGQQEDLQLAQSNTPVGSIIDTPQQVPVEQSLSDGEELVNTSAPEPVQVPVQDSLSDGEELVNTSAPAAVDTTVDQGNGSSYNPTNTSTPGANSFAAGAGTFEGGEEAYLAQRAREQQAMQARFNQPSNGDWRVRLRLAPGSNYLYNSEDPGVLAPLKTSDGVIFPYTPSIQTSYNADYEVTDLTHSNYRGQFYKSSNVGDISITGIFTAQDTAEAEYMLAVIHFFRSVTKMFYGQDAQRGAPPPLVYLIGLGQFQFNNHPCVVKSFSYNLPTDVDYIRTQPNNYGINLLNRRTKPKSAPANTIGSVIGRLGNARDLLGNLLKPGALSGLARNRPGQPGVAQQAVNNTSDATYVPTKIDIQITLLPIQTRNQVSQQFSLESFANGSLLRGGFW